MLPQLEAAPLTLHSCFGQSGAPAALLGPAPAKDLPAHGGCSAGVSRTLFRGPLTTRVFLHPHQSSQQPNHSEQSTGELWGREGDTEGLISTPLPRRHRRSQGRRALLCCVVPVLGLLGQSFLNPSTAVCGFLTKGE